MKPTRREALKGAMAVTAAVGLPKVATARGRKALVVHDPSLAAGRRLAASHGGEALAIDGDRIRFARALFERRPSMVVGMSRPADALLIEEVGREAGYVPVSEGMDGLQSMIATVEPRDRGQVLGWVLAPKG